MIIMISLFYEIIFALEKLETLYDMQWLHKIGMYILVYIW